MGAAELGKRDGPADDPAAMEAVDSMDASPAVTREFFSAVRIDALNSSKELLRKLALTKRSVAVSATLLFLSFCFCRLGHVAG